MSEWKEFFDLSPEFREQEGQRAAFELAARISPDDPGLTSWLFQLVTGYGKTLTAYGVFWILRKRGIVDRMLVLVPTDEQRTQFVGDADDARNLMGIDEFAWSVEKLEREYRVARSGGCSVFVATYQQLDDKDFFRDLLSLIPRWLVVADECHHLGEEGRWSERFLRLPNVRVRLGLSATPIRSDLKKVIGFPEEPNVRVDYKRAFEEGVVKRIVGKIDQYQLVVEVDGKPDTITTESLRSEGVTDFSKYEAKRQLRYNSNYLDRMLLEPIQDLLIREERHPDQNRMVVFAMTCRHAHHVANQFNLLCEQLDIPFKADWIGDGEGVGGDMKSRAENQETVKAFREGRIQILVQVGKCNEGFNVKQVSVEVFLHLIGAQPRLIQEIGRCLRRNKAIPFDEDSASVYASADTEVAQVIRTMEAEAIGSRPGGGDGPGYFPIPDLMLIKADYVSTDIVGPNGIDVLSPEQRAFCERFGIPAEDYISHVGMTIPPAKHGRARTSPQERLKVMEEQVKMHTSTLTTNILRIAKVNGMPLDAKKAAGKVKHSINTEWIKRSNLRHDQMTDEHYILKNKWLQEVNKKLIESKEVPSWARLS